MKPKIIPICIWVIFSNQIPLGIFLNTIHIFLNIDTFVESLVNWHMKFCHRTFTFLMKGATNPPKKIVGECSSLRTRRCQNYLVLRNGLGGFPFGTLNKIRFYIYYSFIFGKLNDIYICIRIPSFLGSQIIFVFGHQNTIRSPLELYYPEPSGFLIDW